MTKTGPVVVAIDFHYDNLVAVKAFFTDAFPGKCVFYKKYRMIIFKNNNP